MRRSYLHHEAEPVVDRTFRRDNNIAMDVIQDFRNLNERGDYLAAWDGGKITGRRYTPNIFNFVGLDNHLQGLQRLTNTNYLIMSGGDPHDSESHLFVIEMGTRAEIGGWGSNVMKGATPPESDRVVASIAIDKKMWHAGGLGLSGDILAVPIYSAKPVYKIFSRRSFQIQSKVRFYSFQDPKQPGKFDFEIDYGGDKAYATALVRRRDGHFLLAVWSSNKAEKNGLKKANRRLDFYISKSENFADGFDSEKITWYPHELQLPSRFEDYQMINFVKQADGRLFLVGTHDTSRKAPTFSKENVAALFQVEIPDTATFKRDPKSARIMIRKIITKKFKKKDKQFNMDAASGIYVDSSGRLLLYSSYHFFRSRKIKFNEFRPIPFTNGQLVTHLEEAWIELYEHDNYQGRCMWVNGGMDSTFTDYKKLKIAGEEFNDKVSSARFQIPAGQSYQLFEHQDFGGKQIELPGSGEVTEIEDFREIGFGDKVSSSRYS